MHPEDTKGGKRMRDRLIKFWIALVCAVAVTDVSALSNSDVSIRYLAGYFWLDNACTIGGPQGKVVSFRIVNTRGSVIKGLQVDLGSIGFTATGAVSYTSGTPSFNNRTASNVYFGDLAAGDSVTAFFFIGYNCLIYPNNSALTTDYVTLPLTVRDVQPGAVSYSTNQNIYVIRNSSNNTISMTISGPALVGTITTVTVDYTISNVKPNKLIDLELNSLSAFPAGYEIIGCKVDSTTINADFPLNLRNTHYTGNVISNLPSGGFVRLIWYLKVTAAGTAISGSNLLPFVVADAGGANRWQTLSSMPSPGAAPVNPLRISKRVNQRHVLTNDTVVYTVVLHNSNPNYDITIDRLIDNLPRDYKYRYIETNPGVFPRLVTHQNSTIVPDYNDTNTLLFRGTKELSTNVFSWVVPRSDSVKLIYSVRVSGTPGLLDTNFVSAFVGSSVVGDAHDVVNVYTMLETELVQFNTGALHDAIQLNWTISGAEPGLWFELFRQNADANDYESISSAPAQTSVRDYQYTDRTYNPVSALIAYMLRMHYPDGAYKDYFTSATPLKTGSIVRFVHTATGIELIPAIESVQELAYEITDVQGRVLKSGKLHKDSGFFLPRTDFGTASQFVYMRVQTPAGQIATAKIPLY